MKDKITGLAFFVFLFAIAGIGISYMTLKEDVLSTAKTVFEYFPMKYQVTPAATWQGAIVLGFFTSIVQVVAGSVAFSKKFSNSLRTAAFIVFLAGCGFDNWTDVVFRSGNLTGDIKVAIVTTVAFYSFGSEILQGLSLIVFFTFWRLAISDLMWGWAKFLAGLNSIGEEWKRFRKAANKKENERFPDENHPKPVQSMYQINKNGQNQSNQGSLHRANLENRRFVPENQQKVKLPDWTNKK